MCYKLKKRVRECAMWEKNAAVTVYVLTRYAAGGAQEGTSAWAVGVQEPHGGGRGVELVLESV